MKAPQPRHSSFAPSAPVAFAATLAAALLLVGCSSTEPSDEDDSSEKITSSSSRTTLSSTIRSSSSGAQLSSSSIFVISSGTGEAAVNNQECTYSATANTLACEEKTYKTVTINNVVWMAENLNYGQYVERMPTDDNLTMNEIDPQLLSGAEKFCDQNDENDCEERGALYQWHTMMGFETNCANGTLDCGDRISDGSHQGICPKGWHIPSREEWTAVALFSGGAQRTINSIENVEALVTEEIRGNNSSGLNIYATYRTFIKGGFTTNTLSQAAYHGKRGTSLFDSQIIYIQYDANISKSVRLSFSEMSGAWALEYKSYAEAVRCVKD